VLRWALLQTAMMILHPPSRRYVDIYSLLFDEVPPVFCQLHCCRYRVQPLWSVLRVGVRDCRSETKAPSPPPRL
jgi:hypothetical protein